MKNAFNAFFAWFGRAHSESDGTPSSTRFHASYGLVLTLTPFMLVWVFLCLTKSEFVSIPESVGGFFSLWIATFLGAKAIAKSQETKTPPPSQ